MEDEEMGGDAILDAIEKVKAWAMSRMLSDGDPPASKPSDMPEEEMPGDEPEAEIEAEALEIEAEPKKPTVMKSYSFSKPPPGDAPPPPKKKVPVKRR